MRRDETVFKDPTTAKILQDSEGQLGRLKEERLLSQNPSPGSSSTASFFLLYGLRQVSQPLCASISPTINKARVHVCKTLRRTLGTLSVCIS